MGKLTSLFRSIASRTGAAVVLTLAGAGLLVAGIAAMHPPSAMIVAGAALGALGFFGLDIGGRR